MSRQKTVRNWEKRKLFRMSRQCTVPSHVAHVIGTHSGVGTHLRLSAQTNV